MNKSGSGHRHTVISVLLLVIGSLFLAQGLTKPLLWLAGARSAGYISYQENAVSSRGALWVRYTFSTPDGTTHTGTAMTSTKNARFRSMQVAYLPIYPDLNMPAYMGYAALISIAWSLSGIIMVGVSRLFMKASGKTGR